MSLLLFFELINNFFRIIHSFILSIPLFEIINSKEKDLDIDEIVVSYINDSNKLIIFVLGTTVTANIYLYNTRMKISSSSIWASKQIKRLFKNLTVNLSLIFIGYVLLNYEFISNKSFSNSIIRTLLIAHFALKILSIWFFIQTLLDFISSFQLDKSMKKSIKKIDSSLYPKRWSKIFLNRGIIINHSINTLERQLSYIRMRSNYFRMKNNYFWLDKLIIYINKYKIQKVAYSVFFIKKQLLKFTKLIYISFFILLVVFRKHKLTEQTSHITKKDIEKLKMDIEIHCQYLEYIITTNSDKSISEHTNQWNALFSKIVIMLFHINNSKEIDNEITVLYKHLLHNHSKLISKTSNSYENRKYHKEYIKLILLALAYKEEYKSKDEFIVRTKELEGIYFDELSSLLISLMQNKNFEIFKLLQSEELNLNSFLSNRKENSKYYGNWARKENYENLFINALIKMIELNISENLTSVMAIILSLNNVTEVTYKNFSGILAKKKTHIPEKIEEAKINLSDSSKKGLIFAAIKANEIGDYKAAGYIVKILSSNIQLKYLIDVVKETFKSTQNRNIYYDTGIEKIDFNDFSFKYCLNKTLILMLAQYFHKQDISEMNKLLFLIEDMDVMEFRYLVIKLKKKKKDYNMVALEDTYLDVFEEYISNEIYSHDERYTTVT